MDATRVGPSRARLIRTRDGRAFSGCLAAATCVTGPAAGKSQRVLEVGEEQVIARCNLGTPELP